MLSKADRLYTEKSFGAAADAYESALKTSELVSPRREEIEYRFDEALGRAKRWDRALAEGVAFVQRHRGTLWEARGLTWLGRLYLAVPNEGWSVGKQFFRGHNAPTGALASKPEYRVVLEQDLRDAQDALEAARVLFPQFRSLGADVTRDEVQLDFDLARTLRLGQGLRAWARRRDWLPPSDPAWHVDPTAPYSTAWPLPRKLMFLYRSAAEVAGSDRHQAALALLGEALWLQEYQPLIRGYAVRWTDGKPHPIHYPYESVKPDAVLQELLHDPRYADDEARDVASLTLAACLADENQPDHATRTDAAARVLARFLRDRPSSRWAIVARHHLQRIRQAALSVGPAEPVQLPGRPARIRVAYRNLDRFHLQVFRLRLQDLYRNTASNTEGLDGLNQVGSLLGKRRYAGIVGPALVSRDVTPAVAGDPKAHQQSITLPIQAAGAYLVEVATAGVRATNVVIVSDLALVQKMAGDHLLFFAANARTGVPVPGVKIVAFQTWEAQQGEEYGRTRGVTGTNGLATVPYARGATRRADRARALAYVGDRYALTGESWLFNSDDDTVAPRIYSLTDRAVYRPGQTVHYRLVVMRHRNGRLRPAVGERVQVAISDPAGHPILKRTAKCGEFGTLHGDLELGAGAALGAYHAQATVGKASTVTSSGFQFQVEEYKKPEFEVKVTPERDQVLLGETATVRITARYYFGGPVPNAHVKYRILRNDVWHGYRFPRDFDALYGYSGNTHSSRTAPQSGGRSPIDAGETRTDARGEVTITFHTAASTRDSEYADATYTIEAEVQDASRHVVAGAGTVQAAVRGVHLYLEARRGYTQRGELTEVDVASLTPSDQPVSASGQITVVSDPDGPKSRRREVVRRPFQTAADGKGRFLWRPARGGYYRVTFVTRDSRGQEMKGAVGVWVAGPELQTASFTHHSLALEARNPFSTEGQTAHFLLVTPAPGCTVLLTREAGNAIIETRLVHVLGRAVELALPIRRDDSPEISFVAALVHDRKLFTTEETVQVPPVSQIARIALRTDRARYQPGDRATLHLTARDFRGRPLRAELSLGISDTSLDTIAEDNFRDIGRELFTRPGVSWWVPSSLDTAFDERVDDTQAQPSTEGGPDWTLPSGMGRIAEWPGGKNEDLHLYPGLTNLRNGEIPRTGEGYGWDPDAPAMMGGMSATVDPTFGGLQNGAILGRQTRIGNQDGFAPIYEAGRSDISPDHARRRFAWPEADMDAVKVRRIFADTALWAPSVVTDARGNATLRMTWPDNLTRWRARAVAVGMDGAVGGAEATVETKKDLLVRLSTPRFVVERDTLTFSATVQNALPRAAQVQVRLKLGSDAAELVRTDRSSEPSVSMAETSIEVPANGEKRVDWTVRARKAGPLPITVTALAADGSDAMQVSLPVVIHGAEKVVARSGVLHEESRVELPIQMPDAQADPDAELVVQLQPSLALVALDALPYLIDDPYGCVEQTLSRFVPAILVKKTLNELGYSLNDLRRRAAQATPTTAQPGVRHRPNSPYTASKLPLDADAPPPIVPGRGRAINPVFSETRLRTVVASSLERLRAMQHDDGGWGWWTHDATNPYMTAYVVYGLQLARDAGTVVDPALLNGGLRRLRADLTVEKDPQQRAFEARVLAMDPQSRQAVRSVASWLFEAREKLSIYAKALLAETLHDLGQSAEAGIVLGNIADAAQIDVGAGTVAWNEDVAGYRWYEDSVETHTAVLMACLTIQPNHPLIPMLARWLAHEREDGHWSSTRETALAALALARYARAAHELAPDETITVSCGRVKRTFRMTPANVLFSDRRLTLRGAEIGSGGAVTITRSGTGTLYYSVTSRAFSQEEPIQPVSGDLAVERHYFRLIPVAARPTPTPSVALSDRPNPFLLGRYDQALEAEGSEADAGDAGDDAYRREPLVEGDSIGSGDLIEVVLQLRAKQDLDYLVFEDIKPAGCEPVDLQSGEDWEPGVYSNRELRDQKVAFFIDAFSAGSRQLSYRLYAETPGRFHVLPTNGYAMYAPKVRALSGEASLQIDDPGSTLW
jgi:uncharacterized protein YfaS (alpha-2-macroglobulin family)